MIFNLNWVDLVIFFILLLIIFDAAGRSLITELLDLASFLLAFFLSFRYYNFPAKFFELQFQIPHGLTLVLGFVTIWFFAEAIFYLLVRLLSPKIPAIKYFWINALSVVPAAFRGLVLISLMLVLIATFPIQPQIKKAVLESKIASFILKKAYALEQPVKQVFGGVTSDTLTFLTIKPRTDERVDLGFQTKELTIDESSEREMVDLVNQERTQRGLKTLIFDVNLRDLGRSHSKDMFERGYFSHFSPEGESVADRAEKAGVDFLVIGENLAYAPNLEHAHKGLMDSKGHRENILSEDYGKIGIGVIDGGVYGKMFTQVFSN